MWSLTLTWSACGVAPFRISMIVLLEKWLREWRPKQNSRGRGNAWIFMAFARLAAAETSSTKLEFKEVWCALLNVNVV